MKSATDFLFSENIISLMIDGLHDEASSAIAGAAPQLAADRVTRLDALVRIDKRKPEGVAQIDETRRRTYRAKGTWIGYLFELGSGLMDIERWAEAEIVLDELIALSKAKEDFYFLDDARLRRALCLRYLGRKRELEALKAEIPVEAEAFICREDLGGCIRLTRDHLV